MRFRLFTTITAAACLVAASVAGGETPPQGNETQEQRNARMAWWREAKFGLFIHWGIYAVPAGSYQGKQISGIGEWIQRTAEIPVATYRDYAKQFNPVNYHPESWADLAVEAGMRYVVITAKHHDGFALYPSEVTNWDVADATPYQRDLLTPLAEAVRRRGLKFGLYYSQAQDWVHPGGAKAGLKEGDGWDPAHCGNFDNYLSQIAVPQVREILSRFQPDVLWWDTPVWMNDARAAQFQPLLAACPTIIQNDRLGGNQRGDLTTPEQTIPSQGYPGRDWETCMTINDTWGFKQTDQNWKSPQTLVANLVDIASKGGNYLLNIGPDASGTIPAESVERLRQVGRWLKAHGESIYGSQASPLRKFHWGRCTRKSEGTNTVLYLHVLNWPADGQLLLPGIQGEVLSSVILGQTTPIPTQACDGGIQLTVPNSPTDSLCPTIKLVLRDTPSFDLQTITPDSDGVLRLLPSDSTLTGSAIRAKDHDGQSTLCYWVNPKDTAAWTCRPGHEGKYLLRIEASTPESGAVLMVQGPGKLACTVPQTGNYGSYQSIDVGELNLAKGQPVALSLVPVPDGWKPVNVRKVELIPLP